MSVYLYAVGRAELRPPRTGRRVEPAVGDLRTVRSDDLRALVADVAPDRVTMTAANLAAHQEVVEEAARKATVLPARFATIVESDEVLMEEVLQRRGPAIRRALDAVDGRVEMRVGSTYDSDAALRDAVRTNPRIRRLSQRVQQRPAAATYYDRIALGEAVMQQLALAQQAAIAELEARLRPVVVAAKPLDAGPVGSRTAYLVDRHRLGRFDDIIESFADEQHGRMAFEVLGPLAPWDFADHEDVDTRSDRRRTPALASRQRWDS